MAIGKSIGGIFVSIGGDTSKLRKEVRAAQRLIRSAFGRDALQAGEKALQSFKYIAAGIGAISAASIKLAADLEQSTIAFETFLGSAAAAKDMLQKIENFAAKTPFQFDDLESSARMLLAYGISAKDIITTLEKLGNIAAATNQPLSELALVYGKVAVQNRMFMKDVNQLNRRAVPILKELEKEFGATGEEVRALVEDGKADFNTLQNAINRLTGEGGRFFGLIEKQSRSASGLFSTFKDNIIANMREIGATLIKELNVKETLKKLISALQSAREKIKKLGLKEALLDIVGPEVKLAVIALAGAITFSLIPAVTLLYGKLALLIIPMGKFAALGAAIALAGYGIYKIWDKVGKQFLKFTEVLKFSFNQEIPKAIDFCFKQLKTTAYRVLADVSLHFYGLVEKLPKAAANYWKPILADLVSFTSKAAVDSGREANKAFKDFKFAEKMVNYMNEARVNLEKFGFSAENISGYITRLNSATNIFVNSGLSNITSYGKTATAVLNSYAAAINKILGFNLINPQSIPEDKKAEKTRAGLSSKSGKTKADTEKKRLIESAKDFHKSLRQEWITTTQSEKQQLDAWLAQQIQKLEESKKYNKQYQNDVVKLNEIYQTRLADIDKRETESKLRKQEENDNQINRERENLKAWIEEQKTLSAQESEIWRLSREANLAGYLEYWDTQKAKLQAHFQGTQEFINTHMNLTLEANRSQLSYMAEAYQTVYTGLSNALTDIVTGARGAGEAIRDLGKQLITMVVRWVIQRKLAQTLGASMEKAATAASMASGAAVASAWAPAAAMVSAATMGANIPAAMAGLTGLRAFASALALPALAEGGIVTKPTLALIGEAGPEAVVPLGKNAPGGNVQINVINKSGVPVNANAKTRFDGTRTVVDLFIDGYERNVSGIRDLVGGRK
jgi:tape measure domain-containing protein